MVIYWAYIKFQIFTTVPQEQGFIVIPILQRECWCSKRQNRLPRFVHRVCGGAVLSSGFWSLFFFFFCHQKEALRFISMFQVQRSELQTDIWRWTKGIALGSQTFSSHLCHTRCKSSISKNTSSQQKMYFLSIFFRLCSPDDFQRGLEPRLVWQNNRENQLCSHKHHFQVVMR